MLRRHKENWFRLLTTWFDGELILYGTYTFPLVVVNGAPLAHD